MIPSQKQLAGIEYLGVSGVSAPCKDAVMRFLQFGDRILRVRILSCSNTHCLLLNVNESDLAAVKSCFSSGYPGEGPHTFSLILRLLEVHGAEIEEYEVDQSMINRVDRSCLTTEDLANLDAARPIRPSRWYNYVWDKHLNERLYEKGPGILWKYFPLVIPFSIIDRRITDLAMNFLENPDDSLMTGYRRLEDIVRKRTNLDEHGAKLFSQAFQGEKPKLIWEGLTASERDGRALLFIAAYKGFRNSRAHRELSDSPNSLVAEFLLLNHLYVLESQATRQIESKKDTLEQDEANR